MKSYKLQDLGNMYPKVDILIPGDVTWMKNASMYIRIGAAYEEISQMLMFPIYEEKKRERKL